MEKLTEELNYFSSLSDLYQKRQSDFYYEEQNKGKSEFDFVSEEFELASTCYFDMLAICKKNNSILPLFEKITDYYDFIKSKSKSLEPFYKNLNESKTLDTDKTLKWKGTPLQFAELTKALIESELVSPELSDKEIFNRMKQFLNVGDFNKSSRLAEIKKRTINQTPLINKLETGLINWIKNKD